MLEPQQVSEKRSVPLNLKATFQTLCDMSKTVAPTVKVNCNALDTTTLSFSHLQRFLHMEKQAFHMQTGNFFLIYQ
jgi:hypothetical protein